jgi:hypothetical protein
VQKKFAKLKSWITETQRASVEQLPGGIDEDSLDSSVSPIVKEELVTLRKAANTGHIPPETYYRKVLETFRVSPSDHVTALQIIKDAESGIKLFDGASSSLRLAISTFQHVNNLFALCYGEQESKRRSQSSNSDEASLWE